MSEQPQEDREPPRLQDTTERSALPLPLPDDPQGDPAPVDPAPVDPVPAVPPPAEPTPSDSAPSDPAPADKSPAVDEPVTVPPAEAAAAVAAAPADAAPSGNGAEPGFPPPLDPFSTPDEGPRPEVLVGAAFVGGLALALLIRRLGR